MGYDSLRIELRYRHIWQTKWAAAANATTSEDGTIPTSSANNAGQPAGVPGQNSGAPGTQGNAGPQPRGRRSTSLNRNVHYETEPDPGVDSPMGNKPPPSSTSQPANYNSAASGAAASGGAAGNGNGRGRHKSAYRQYRLVIFPLYIFYAKVTARLELEKMSIQN